MLGYSNTQTSLEAYNHHKELKERVPEKLHKHLNYAYNWINDRNFSRAMYHNTMEGWLWLNDAMVNPPEKVIQKFANSCTENVDIVPHIPPCVIPKPPRCRICEKSIAGNIQEKCKFSMIICKCETLWCHQDCADASVLADPQCSICKDYFILSPCCSSLRSTVAKK
jgi:hypothetical protein